MLSSKFEEKKFNPYRLKVRIHVGVNADDPIDRGTTPDYNDCFFNCAGQKPNYVDVFAVSGRWLRGFGKSILDGWLKIIERGRLLWSSKVNVRRRREINKSAAQRTKKWFLFEAATKGMFGVCFEWGMQNVMLKLCASWHLAYPFGRKHGSLSRYDMQIKWFGRIIQVLYSLLQDFLKELSEPDETGDRDEGQVRALLLLVVALDIYQTRDSFARLWYLSRQTWLCATFWRYSKTPYWCFCSPKPDSWQVTFPSCELQMRRS